MKKIMVFAACVMLAAVTNAASVGWTMATGSTAYAGNAYSFFVIGQNGTESIATITALLDAGADFSSYAFGTGVAPANGNITMTAANSGKTLTNGETYTGFFVLFDSDTLKAGDTKYIVLSGQPGLTKQVTASAASVTFVAGNVSSTLSNASNWQTYAAPEPTSGLLMLLGVAGLALRRRRA